MQPGAAIDSSQAAVRRALSASTLRLASISESPISKADRPAGGHGQTVRGGLHHQIAEAGAVFSTGDVNLIDICPAVPRKRLESLEAADGDGY